MPKAISQPQKEKELPAAGQELLEEAEPALELEPGVDTYIEHVEKEPEISNDLTSHIHSHSQAATQVLQTGPTIQLPLMQAEIEEGLHHKVWDSVLWLATWCLKIAKEAHRLGLKVIFGKK